MQRVAIIGSGGAGKSTLARELGRITGLPVHHLDRYMWQSGWVMRPDDEEDRILLDLASRDRWIIDGNYGRTMPVRLAAADTIIFLDLSNWLCAWRIVRRAIEGMRSGQVRSDMADGCLEECDWEFIKWVWNYPRRSRPKVLNWLEQHRGRATVYRLRTPREIRELAQLFDAVTPRVSQSSV
jgi:adenylate kinase family enzyme